MSLCENGVSKAPQNREIVFNRLNLDLNAEYKILNLMLTMDTGQANVQLQNKSVPVGPSAKLKPMAVILSDDLVQKIKDEVTASVYCQFEAKQVKSSIIQKIADEQQSLEIDTSEIESEYQDKIIDARVTAREAKEKLQDEKDAKKAVQAEMKIDSELSETITKLQEEKQEKIKEFHESERAKVHEKYEPELLEINKVYGIS